MLADGHLHIMDNLSVPYISLNRFALDIYHLREGDLRKHPLRLFLPIKQIDCFISGHVDRIIYKHLWLLPLPEHIHIHLHAVLGAQYQAARHVFGNAEDSMDRAGHIEHIGVVHEIENHQKIFARGFPHPAPELLDIDGLRHGWPRHKENLGVRRIPAFIQKITGACVPSPL